MPMQGKWVYSCLGGGGIPHAVNKLSPRGATTEAVHLEPVLYNKTSYCSEQPAHHDRE